MSGGKAGMRTLRRLGARKLATVECPVVYEAPIATGLIGHFVNAVSGGSLYRKSSFLLDSVGTQVFAPRVSRFARSRTCARGQASAPFDDEGVATRPRDVVRDGVVQGYFLGSYSARKLGHEIDGERRRQSQSGRQPRRRRPASAVAADGSRACW